MRLFLDTNILVTIAEEREGAEELAKDQTYSTRNCEMRTTGPRRPEGMRGESAV